jgi:hypothetical protein
MSIQVYPTPVASGGGATAQSVAVASANTLYRVNNINLSAGLYNVTANTIGTLTMEFFNSAGTSITTATTSSTAAINITQTVSYIILRATSGGGTAVISLVASQLSPISGVVSTLTSSGTWNTAGTGWFLVVGGGGGGGSANPGPNNQSNTPGGSSGGVYEVGPVAVSAGTNYTIGGAGAAGTSGTNVAGGNGGATTFGTYTANGGGGSFYNTNIGSSVGAAGTPGGSVGSTSQSVNPVTASTAGTFNWVKTGTTGAGGTGWQNSSQTMPGAGSGIGTGGAGGRTTGTPGSGVSAGSASGYGAGGGGSAQWTTVFGAPSAGTQGVIYIQVLPNS